MVHAPDNADEGLGGKCGVGIRALEDVDMPLSEDKIAIAFFAGEVLVDYSGDDEGFVDVLLELVLMENLEFVERDFHSSH